MEIDKSIAAHHEFAHRTAHLQRGSDVEETAPVTVDLVREAALQNLACVIQALLRVAYPVQQLACERAGATVDPPLKIDNIRHNQFRRGARRWRAQIRNEIADGEIDFVTDRGDNWHRGMKNRARDNLFVELP